jgi:hypothetical protein
VKVRTSIDARMILISEFDDANRTICNATWSSSLLCRVIFRIVPGSESPTGDILMSVCVCVSCLFLHNFRLVPLIALLADLRFVDKWPSLSSSRPSSLSSPLFLGNCCSLGTRRLDGLFADYYRFPTAYMEKVGHARCCRPPLVPFVTVRLCRLMASRFSDSIRCYR